MIFLKMESVLAIFCWYLILFTNGEIYQDESYEQMAKLEESLNIVIEQNERLVDDVNMLKTQNEDLQSEVYKLKSENQDLNNYVEIIATKRETDEQYETRFNQNGTIGFTAYALESRDYNTDDVVIFDGISRSYGDAYHANSSIFTCPVSGYYVFYISLSGYADDYMYAGVMMEGDEVQLFEVYLDFNNDDSSSNMVFTYCESGQKVWVRCSYSGSRLYGNSFRWRSTFSGVLIQAV